MLKRLGPFFVLRSDDLPSCSLFAGYFFDDTDVYVELDGAEAYLKANGQLPHDKEGIYVTCQADGERVRISGDFAGTVPLFLYQTTGFWAVSPSFFNLVQIARARGDRPTVLPDLLQAWRISGAIGQGPTTFQTCLSEITVVPSYSDVVGTRRSVELQHRQRNMVSEYTASLNRYRRLVTGRLQAIVKSGIPLKLDVTGGIDSRAILANAWEAFGPEEFRKLHNEQRIQLRTHPELQLDNEIATNICNALQVDLDKVDGISRSGSKMETAGKLQSLAASLRGFSRKKPTKLDLESMYRQWREACIGRCAVRNDVDPSPPGTFFWTSGVFGGNLKAEGDDEETVDDGRKTLQRHRKNFDSAEIFEIWRERIIADVKEVQRRTGGEGLPFWPLWNREFAMRMHARQTLGSLRLYPLGDQALVEAVNCLTVSELRKFKVHHDLISAGSRVLFEQAYDQKKKHPSEDLEISKLETIEGRPSGTVFGALQPRSASHESGHSSATNRAFDRYLFGRSIKLSSTPSIRKAMGKGYCERVANKLSNFNEASAPMKGHIRAHAHGVHLAEMLIESGTLNKDGSRANYARKPR